MAAPMSPTLYGCVLPNHYAVALDSPQTPVTLREAINTSVERVSAIPTAIRDCLSFREAEVLACLLDVARPTNKDLGEQLGISVHSVHSHLKSIYRKLDVNSRREAALATVRAGWRPGDDA